MKRLIAILFAVVLPFVAGEAKAAEAKDSVKYTVRFFDDSAGQPIWHPTKVLQDSHGFIWLSSWNGLLRFDGYEFTSFKVQPGDGNVVTSDRLRWFMMEESGTFICVVDEGVFRFDPHTCRFSSVDEKERKRFRDIMEQTQRGVPGPSDIMVGGTLLSYVRQPITDNQGNNWYVGQNCLWQTIPMSQPFTRLEQVPRMPVRSVFQDRAGRIWISSKGPVAPGSVISTSGVVAVYDRNLSFLGYLSNDGRLHKEQATFAPIYSMFQDSNGQMWLGSKPNGLFRLKETAEGAFEVKQFDVSTHSPEDNSVYDVAEDLKGRLWIATHGAGIMCMENPKADNPKLLTVENCFRSFPKECSRMRRLLMTSKGVMLATTTQGIVVVDGMSGEASKVTFRRHCREANRKESLSNSATMDVIEDSEGNIYVSTESGGVNKLLTKDFKADVFEFRHFRQSSGLGSDIAYSMTPIRGGILLICNNQLVKLNTTTGDSHSYGMSFWNDSFHFSDARQLRLDGGRWILPLEEGAIVLDQKDLKRRSISAPLVLTRISLGTDSVMWGADYIDTLRLSSSSQRNVTVNYATLDYRSPSAIRYETRIDDDEEWSAPTQAREITLFDLDPGTHVLQIRSTNSEGLWQDTVRTLTIEVEPEFFESLWGQFVLVLLLGVVVAGITYMVVYIRILKKKRQETLDAYLALMENQTAADSGSEAETQGENAEQTKAEDVQETTPAVIVTPEDDRFMKQLMQFVEDHISDGTVGVEEMALATATSKSSLNRRLKTLLGVTPGDFLREARIKQAAKLLRTTSMNVSEIAFRCGFSDPKYFSKCFKASFGCTPKEYRAN